jgi:TorA maturation chaperone TorD
MSDARSWIYAHLGDLFADAAAPLAAPPELDPARPRTRQAIEELCLTARAADASDTAADQVRLFVNAKGGVAAPPYASWYLDGSLAGPSTGLVEEAYASQCLEADPGGGQPLDYIVTELEFLHFLCRHQRAARATGDSADLVSALDAETRFLDAHFFRWVPRFARAIRAAAPCPVFAGAAAVLEAFCEESACSPARRVPCASASTA